MRRARRWAALVLVTGAALVPVTGRTSPSYAAGTCPTDCVEVSVVAGGSTGGSGGECTYAQRSYSHDDLFGAYGLADIDQATFPDLNPPLDGPGDAYPAGVTLRALLADTDPGADASTTSAYVTDGGVDHPVGGLGPSAYNGTSPAVWDFATNRVDYIRPLAGPGDQNNLARSDPQNGFIHNDPIAITFEVTGNLLGVTLNTGPGTATVGSPATFTASTACADGEQVGYQWRFGGGAWGAGEATEHHTWNEAGTYPVRVRATTPSGASGSAIAWITVTAATGSPSPTASPTAQPTGGGGPGSGPNATATADHGPSTGPTDGGSAAPLTTARGSATPATGSPTAGPTTASRRHDPTGTPVIGLLLSAHDQAYPPTTSAAAAEQPRAARSGGGTDAFTVPEGVLLASAALVVLSAGMLRETGALRHRRRKAKR